MLARRASWFGRAAGGLVVVAVVLGAAAMASPGASERIAKEGGTFRITTAFVGTIDPALDGGDLLGGAACGTLMGYPDRRGEGLRPRPELAETEPVLSRDGKTYTFTIRKNARFSTGATVTARAFAHALERIRDPALDSGELAAEFDDVRDVIAKGRTLTLRLTKRDPLLLARTTWLCAVPPILPVEPEGASAPLPSPAPYYVAEYVPGERLVLERNRFYRGERPHRVTRFVANLAVDTGSAVDQVARGTFDTVLGVNAVAPRSEELA